MGMLVPRNQRMKAGEMDSLAADGAGTVEDVNSDDVSISNDSLSPSSIGLSCTVAGDTRGLHVTARWGRYKREKSETLVTDKGNPLTVEAVRSLRGPAMSNHDKATSDPKVTSAARTAARAQSPTDHPR